jgi:hypothetical protein
MVQIWRVVAIVLGAAWILYGASASAQPLDTGYDTSGNLIPAGSTSATPAWVGFDQTNNVALPTYSATYAADYPGAWIAPPAGTFWVTPAANASGGATTYPSPPSASDVDITWTQTFSLTANEAASDILGEFAVDNLSTELLVNGHVVALSSQGGFGFFTSFDIPYADLTVGADNTIEFFTVNSGYTGPNPTGLLVAFTQIPEPASLAMFGVCLVGLTMAARRRSL